MTREEMARELDNLLLDDVTNERLALEEVEALTLAAAALRQTCAGCKWFVYVDAGKRDCARHLGPYDVPADGSGFCHRWEGK